MNYMTWQPGLTLNFLNKKIDALEKGGKIIIDGLPDTFYHQSKGISCSMIKKYIENPLKYHYEYILTEGEKITKTEKKSYFDFGKAIHTLLLEPHLFDDTYVKQDESIKVRRGKIWDEFEEVHAGKTILTSEQWEHIEYFSKQDSYADLAKYFVNGTPEQSCFYYDPNFDCVLKCRPDFYNPNLGLMIDLKTINNASPEYLSHQSLKLGYHVQDAFYSYIYNYPEFIFVFVESNPPFPCTFPVSISSEAKELGKLLFTKAINDIKNSIENDIWTSYTDSEVEITLNFYQKNLLEQMRG